MSKDSPNECFVLQPFGKKMVARDFLVDFDMIFTYLKKIENILPDFPIHIFRADTELRDINLFENIVTLIDGSAFCIADITGANPNVMYELGVTWGRRKPFIILYSDPNLTRDSLPADLQGFLVVNYSMNNLEMMVQNIVPHLRRVKEAMLIDKIKASQIYARYFSRANNEQLIRLIKEAKERIYILLDDLYGFSASLCEIIVDTLKANPELNIRLLTLNPASKLVELKALQLALPTKILLEEMNFSISSIQNSLNNFKTRIEIRLFDELQYHSLFIIDNQIYACTNSALNRTLNNCAFQITVEYDGSSTFVNNFERIWITGIPF